MKLWKLFGVGVMAVGLVSTNVVAQSPSQGSGFTTTQGSAPQNSASVAAPNFTYQGQLKKAGMPVNGTCD